MGNRQSRPGREVVRRGFREMPAAAFQDPLESRSAPSENRTPGRTARHADPIGGPGAKAEADQATASRKNRPRRDSVTDP